MNNHMILDWVKGRGKDVGQGQKPCMVSLTQNIKPHCVGVLEPGLVEEEQMRLRKPKHVGKNPGRLGKPRRVGKKNTKFGRENPGRLVKTSQG